MLSIFDFASRLYASLLCLYPHRFRQVFADEMQGVFVEALIEARKRNTAASLGLVYREFRDLPVCLV